MLPAALVVLLAGQLGIREWQRRPLPLRGPALGAELPETWIRGLEDGRTERLSTPGTSCTVVVFVSSHCGVCQRMRTSWPARLRVWRDSVPASIRVVWASREDASALKTFHAGYDFAGVRLAQLADFPHRSQEALGIYGTPTTYLLDRWGRLRVGVLGDQLPPADSAYAACR